jgi:hypothetical protein
MTTRDPVEVGPFRGAPSFRRFVGGAIAGLVSLLVVVGAVNAVVDPYGYVGTAAFPTAILSDRATKACLAERLRTAPNLVVLGSSRAMKVEPAYLEARTGLSTFNAAVSSASPQDAWAFANFLHDRFPHGEKRVLWLLDVESFRPKPVDPGLLDTPALARYFSASMQLRARASGLWTLLSWHALDDSVRVVRKNLGGAASASTAVPCTYRRNGVTEYTPNGFRSFDFHDLAVARGASLSSSIAATATEYGRIYRTGFPRLAPDALRWFDRTLEAMNAWGVRPLVVLTPVQPTLLRRIGPQGWWRRHADVVRYLDRLHGRRAFELLDASRIGSFGGRPGAFYDGVHMKVANVRRLVNWALERAGGTFEGRT